MSEATRKTKSNSDESTATQTPKASVATDIAAAIPAVEAKQVHKAFGDLHVLKGIDLTVEPGTVTVILGPSGSGKSTFCVSSTSWRRSPAARSTSMAR